MNSHQLYGLFIIVSLLIPLFFNQYRIFSRFEKITTRTIAVVSGLFIGFSYISFEYSWDKLSFFILATVILSFVVGISGNDKRNLTLTGILNSIFIVIGYALLSFARSTEYTPRHIYFLLGVIGLCFVSYGLSLIGSKVKEEFSKLLKRYPMIKTLYLLSLILLIIISIILVLL